MKILPDKKNDFFDGVYDYIVLGVLRPWEHDQCVLWISLVRFAATRASEMVQGARSQRALQQKLSSLIVNGHENGSKTMKMNIPRPRD